MVPVNVRLAGDAGIDPCCFCPSCMNDSLGARAGPSNLTLSRAGLAILFVDFIFAFRISESRKQKKKDASKNQGNVRAFPRNPADPAISDRRSRFLKKKNK